MDLTIGNVDIFILFWIGYVISDRSLTDWNHLIIGRKNFLKKLEVLSIDIQESGRKIDKIEEPIYREYWYFFKTK